MLRILHIENLDCPVCAEALQGDIQKIKGVSTAQVDYVTQTITVDVEREEVLQKVIKTANKFEKVHVLDGATPQKKRGHGKEWAQIALSAALFALAILTSFFFHERWSSVAQYILYGGAYLAVGYPVLLSTVKNLCKGRIFDENFLMTVASVGAIALGEFAEGVAVMLLYQLGELLQSLAVGSSRNSVAELMQLKCERALRLVGDKQEEVRPEDLLVGDRVLVRAGEKAPCDGVLLSDFATVDTKSLTGEAALFEVEKGEEILSGSLNAGNAYELKIFRPYADSAVGRILDMVENASSGKAKPEKFIAKFARYYTPIVCGLALLLAVGVPLIGGLTVGGGLYFWEFSRWLRSALTFLVISCPCALVISVPLTYFSGLGACAKQGILVKGATYLDVLAKTKTVAFDKTGTLTEGNFVLRRVRTETGVEEKELLSLAAALEKSSTHPIAKAFAGVETNYFAEEVCEIAGKGLTAKIEGERVLLGNAKLLEAEGIDFPLIESADTLVYVAKKGKCLGYAEIGDSLRKEAKSTLERIKRCGVERAVMLTGDSPKRANAVAAELGLDEVRAGLLPDEKLRAAEELKGLGMLTYVGDGVNDAPVMVAADCAVSMGKLGSAAAVEASDLVLVADDLKALPKAMKIAKKTRRVVFQNILFSIAMKTAFMVLGGVGILPLWLAVFADVGVMLLAVVNSFRVRVAL